MALVLSLRKGEDFYVGNEQFVIDTIHSDVFFRVKHLESGRAYEISDTQATEIMDGVFVSSGEKPQAQMARVAIEAPANLMVLRGDKYRNPPPHIQKRARS